MASAETGQEDGAAPGRRKRILIADGDASQRRFFRDALETENVYEVVEATDSEQIREFFKAADGNIQLLLLDLAIPGSSGAEVLAWVRENSPRTAVIVVSGNRQDEAVMHCLEHGANDLLVKPSESDVVRRTVRRALRNQLSRKSDTDTIRALYPTGNWVELTAPSQFEHLTRMQRFSEGLFASRLPKKVCDDLRMAIQEVGRNAIEWGNRMDSKKEFRISYCIFSDRIVLKFEDEGEGFQPEELPDPFPDPLALMQRRSEEGKRPGGFGLFLVQRVMDEIVYSEKGNVLLLTKFIPS